jgi:hypothetical protein
MGMHAAGDLMEAGAAHPADSDIDLDGRGKVCDPDCGEREVYMGTQNSLVIYGQLTRGRRAFSYLFSDAERARFIEQFWDQRNPTPGSARQTGRNRIASTQVDVPFRLP